MKYDYEKNPQGIKFDINERNINILFLSRCISKSLLVKNKMRILEIGSGGGRNLLALHQKYGRKVELYGTDISNTAINYAKSLKIGRFYIVKSEFIPIKKKFDFILLIDVLEHLDTKKIVRETLDNALLYLKNDGYIYISVPIELNKFSITWFYSKLPYLKNLTKTYYGHSIQFNIKNFLKLIDFNKFKLKEIFYSAHLLTQLLVFFFYLLPKILLQFFFGEEVVENLRDSNEIIKAGKHPFLSVIKRAFLGISYPFAYLAFIESIILRNFSFTAEGMHLLLTKRLLNKKKI